MKTIVLTGVTRGLGRAMCEKFVELGHSVAGCGRRKSELQRLQKEFKPPHKFSELDIRDDARVKKWAKDILGESGVPDIVINNAGLINENAPLWEVSAQEFQDVVDVNLCGMANVIRHFTPAMIEKGSGVFVNFSSTWGRSTSPEVAPYCCTKWGVEGLTQAFAQELPGSMCAVALNPGIIHTDMLESCFSDGASHYESPEEWAERAVPFILKLNARQNGQAVSVPG